MSILNEKLTKMKDSLRKETQKMSTYSVKNVKRREQRFVVMRASVRKEKNDWAAIAKNLESENRKLKLELQGMKKLQGTSTRQRKALRKVRGTNRSLNGDKQYASQMMRQMGQLKKRIQTETSCARRRVRESTQLG